MRPLPHPVASSERRDYIAVSPSTVAAVAAADAARSNQCSVLIEGPTGTGKEWLAKRCHNSGPFVVIDCTNLAPEIAERELFGHIRGSFTGANDTRIGLIQEADGGTAFFDEIGELALPLQGKLLRVLQEKTFRPLGATKELRSTFRVVAATHRDLKAEVAAGRFRQDLYYRLNIVKIKLLPLHERLEDLAALIAFFESKYGIALEPAARERYMAYPWPGNVRQLDGYMQRHAYQAQSIRGLISTSDLSLTVLEYSAHSQADVRVSASCTHVAGENARHAPGLPLLSERNEFPTMAEMENTLIRSALQRTNGNRTGAAAQLGIARATLNRKLKQLRIDL